MPTATIPENAYLAGNFGPVDREVTAFDLRVEGRIPVELEGRYLRNGPNPAVAPDPASYHWFTGDGMVHGIRLRGGKAEWYRNRWVRSQRLALERGEEPPAGPVNGGMNGGPNTNVGGFAGRTWAMVEAGAFPTELTYELDTVAANDFFGTLPGAFSAHPKYDPATGELHAMTYSWGQWLDHVQYVVVGRDGKVTKTLDIPLPGMTMLHDMGLTPNWALVLDQPVLVDLDLAFAGRFPFRWNDDYQGRVGLLPRTATSATDIVWCDISPCYTFHPLNSFETADGLVVMDTIRHERMFRSDILGPSEATGTLERWTFDPVTGRSKEERITDRRQEFPRHDPRVGLHEHRYGYGAAIGDGFIEGDILKSDVTTGVVEEHRVGDTGHAMEPVFVPREGSTAEDDGWLLAVVHDDATNASHLRIIDAQRMGEPPAAVVHLPQRVPYGFHGNWVPDSSVPPPAA